MDLFAPITEAGWLHHGARLWSFAEEHGFRGRGAGLLGVAAVVWLYLNGSRHRSRPELSPPELGRSFLVVVALLSTAVAGLIHHVSLGDTPHTSDEIAYLFEARLIARGHLAAAPRPPVPAAAAANQYLVEGPRGLFSKYPPGWSLLLAPGAYLGWPGLVAPILWLLTLGCLAPVHRHILGPAWGSWATLLLATSPAGVLQAASLMSHTATLFLAALLIRLCVMPPAGAADRRPGLALTGLALALVRAVDIFPLLPLLALLGQGKRMGDRWTARVQGAGAFAGGAALGILGVALYATWAAGSPRLSLYDLADPLDRYGLSARVGQAPVVFGHNLHTALLGLGSNICILSEELWGWPAASLALIPVGLLAAVRRRDGTTGALAASGALTLCFYAGYFHHGGSYGARYLHTLLPLGSVLTVMGLRECLRGLHRSAPALEVLLGAHVLAALSYLLIRCGTLVNYGGVLNTMPDLGASSPTRVFLVAPPRPGVSDLYPSLFSHMDPTFQDGPLFFRLEPMLRAVQERRQVPAALIRAAYPGWTLDVIRDGWKGRDRLLLHSSGRSLSEGGPTRAGRRGAVRGRSSSTP